MRILLIEDDHRLSTQLVKVLTRENYIVDGAANSEEALELIETFPYDLLILDIILPGVDGITLCRQLRDRNFKIPILLLTAKNTNEDKVKAFDSGADDYLVKPFNLPELLARIRALLRRKFYQFSTGFKWGDLALNPVSKAVTYQEKKLKLTLTEYQILELFLRHKQRIFSCGDIIEHLYFFDNPPTESTIRSHLRGLRQKLKNVGCTNLIDTVHGFGYCLKVDKNQDKELPEKKPLLSRQEQVKAALVQSWYEFQESIFSDLVLLEEIAMQLKNTGASAKLSEAIIVAHNLVGILGSLGLHEEALISRQIENLLDEKNWEIGEILAKLRHSLEERSRRNPEDLSLPKNNSQNLTINDSERLLSGKILVVDDDLIFLSYMQKILESTSLEIYTLANPLNFWETLEAVAPDLLILDLKMPDLDGTKICDLVRNESRYHTLPILFISAYLNQDNIQQLATVGADDFMDKSALKLELKSRIFCHLQRAKRLKSLMGNN